MPQNPEKDVARRIHRPRVTDDGLGQGLVHGFVESNQIVHDLFVVQLRVRHPEHEHAGAQGPVFGNHLFQGKTRELTDDRMGFGGGFGIGRRGLAMGLGDLLPARLRGAQVSSDGAQHLLGMVAQGYGIHANGRGGDGFGEVFPRLKNRLDIVEDEIGQAHEFFRKKGKAVNDTAVRFVVQQSAGRCA